MESAPGQSLRTNRDNHSGHFERAARRRFKKFYSADWPADMEHAGLRIGRWFIACTCWGSWGALHIGIWCGAWVFGGWGTDGGAVCSGPDWGCWEPDVPERGTGGSAFERGFGICRACGWSGEAARLPDCVWGG